MKTKVFTILLGLLVTVFPVYAQRHPAIDIEMIRNQQIRFLNQMHSLQHREQNAVNRQKNIFQNYTSQQLETMQEINDVHSELYQVKQDQEKVYQEYIASLEKMLTEQVDAEFKPLEFQNITVPGGNE